MQVFFIGDSTARRAATQLATFLNGTTFDDNLGHSTVSHLFHWHGMHGSPIHSSYVDTDSSSRDSDSVKYFTSAIISHWAPHITDLTTWLSVWLQTGNASTHLFPHQTAQARKVFVLAYSTHDTQSYWHDLLPTLVNTTTGALVSVNHTV